MQLRIGIIICSLVVGGVSGDPDTPAEELRASWPGWASRLLIVDLDTVAKWDRERFRRHWAKLSRQDHRPGRPRIDPEIRRLIRLMA